MPMRLSDLWMVVVGDRSRRASPEDTGFEAEKLVRCGSISESEEVRMRKDAVSSLRTVFSFIAGK